MDEDIGWKVSGSEFSFIALRPSVDVEHDQVKSIGDVRNPSTFCVLVELGNRDVDVPMTLWVERILRQVINYAKGVRIQFDGNNISHLLVSKDALHAGFALEHLGNLILTELRNEFPAIGPLRVTFILDNKEAKNMIPKIESFRKERIQKIEHATEDGEAFFYGCTRCRSFSLAHACTVTPDRPSQCGSRPWYRVKAQAILSPGSVYNPCTLIEKGECLDPKRGEYTGVNESTAQRTDGRVKRVYLHSVFDFPHTACSCFKNIAFYIREVDGIGLMHKGFEGIAPNGLTWTKLANRVAGRQCTDGAVTFSNQYLHSRKFLLGDGGYSRVVWMTEALTKFAGKAIPGLYRKLIATENDVTTIEELKKFLHEQRQDNTND